MVSTHSGHTGQPCSAAQNRMEQMSAFVVRVAFSFVFFSVADTLTKGWSSTSKASLVTFSPNVCRATECYRQEGIPLLFISSVH